MACGAAVLLQDEVVTGQGADGVAVRDRPPPRRRAPPRRCWGSGSAGSGLLPDGRERGGDRERRGAGREGRPHAPLLESDLDRVSHRLGAPSRPSGAGVGPGDRGAVGARLRWAVSYNQARLRRLNDARIAPGGDYVLYWMQAYRRLERNHALDYALRCAEELARPLVVYEGLRLDYPWASRRLHRFVLEGMQANARPRRGAGPELLAVRRDRKGQGRGLLRRLSARARASVVTDDFPCFIVPGQAEALAREGDGPGLRGGLELGRAAVPSRRRRCLRPPTCARASTRPSPRPGRTARRRSPG